MKNITQFIVAEDLDKGPGPRPKSPHMDNEEPIEMAHYPAGHAPEPGTIPAIDRDDFPAPPYPYAVEGQLTRCILPYPSQYTGYIKV